MPSKISDYSSTAASNTSVNGIFIGEGMAPSDVNNAMREILAELKNQQSGADGSNFTVGGNLTVTGTSALNGNTTVGDASTDTVTVNANSVSAPNSLYFNTNLLALDATNNRVGVKNASPSVSLDIGATDAVKVPIGTTAQRPVGSLGYFRYNSTLDAYEGYTSLGWGSIGGGAGATGGGTDQIFVQNDKTVTTSYSIPSNKNAMTTGNITINSGVTITVPSGSRWVIL